MAEDEPATGLRGLALTGLGFVLLVGGAVLLVLPGPGLLLVLAGLVLLSDRFAWARRLTEPVRERAVAAARASVDSPLRIAGTALSGIAIAAVGVVWWTHDDLPLGGFPTGVGLVLSGLVVLGVLGYSWRTYRA